MAVKWLAAADSQAVDFASLYFDQPDHYGHEFGPQSDSVTVAVKCADELIGYLKQKMQAKTSGTARISLSYPITE